MSTTAEQWAAFVREEPKGFVYGVTCCCAFAMRWAARVMGGEVPGAAILERVKGKTAAEAWEVLGNMGGMAEAVHDVLWARGWQQVETPRDFAIVVFDSEWHDSAGVWVDGKVISKTAATGGISVVKEAELKGIFVWES
jgi:hypothetical protein